MEESGLAASIFEWGEPIPAPPTTQSSPGARFVVSRSTPRIYHTDTCLVLFGALGRITRISGGAVGTEGRGREVWAPSPISSCILFVKIAMETFTILIIPSTFAWAISIW